MGTVSPALVAAASTDGLQQWIRSNVIPLMILIIAVMLFVFAQRGDNARSMKVVSGVIIALAVLGLATGGNAENVGGWLSALVTG